MVNAKRKPASVTTAKSGSKPITEAISKLVSAPSVAKAEKKSSAAPDKMPKKATPVSAKKPTSTALPKSKVVAVPKPGKKRVDEAVDSAKTAKSTKVEKIPKEKRGLGKKAKLVRDSFTFPATDYDRIGAMKARLLSTGVAVKKSELVRAGLLTLSNMTDTAILKVIAELEVLKPGRPSR